MFRLAALMGCTACWTAEPPNVEAPAPARAAVRARHVAPPHQDAPDDLLSAANAPNMSLSPAAPSPAPRNPATLPDEMTALANCDEIALVELGKFEVGHGNHAHALVLFDRAFTCSTSLPIAVFAYMAACNSRNEPTAKKYFAFLAANKQPAYAQICIRNGIQIQVP